VQGQHANAVLRQRRAQSVPALVLVFHKLVGKARQNVALFSQRQAIRASFVIAVLDLLHHRSHANLEKFVEIIGGDGEKLQALQKGVVLILGFLEHTTVEREPGRITVQVILRIFQRETSHARGYYTFFRTIPDAAESELP